MKLLGKDKVAAERFWPSGADIEQELKDLLNRRNDFIHKGIFPSDEDYKNDTYRLQHLLELWVLRLLDCPYDAMIFFSDMA